MAINGRCLLPAALAALLSTALCLDAAAQEAGSAEDEEVVPAPEAADEAAEADRTKGFDLGPFLADPSIAVTEAYDDNIFATKNGKVDDFITVISPRLSLTTDLPEHEFGLNAGADIGRYAENTSEDYEDYFVGADGRYDFAPGSNVFAGVNYAREHEERDSPDDVSGAEPTTYDDLSGFLGTAQRFGRVSVRAGGTVERLDFDDVPATLGTINNDDRDRTQYEIGTRVGYRAAPAWRPFMQGAYDVRRYDSSTDDFGFDRDSEGFSVAAGTLVRLGRSAQAEILAGYLEQNYDDDPALQNVEAADFGARVQVQATERTRLTGFVDRSVDETTIPNASASLDTSVGITASHKLSERLEARVPFIFTESDFEGINRRDQIGSAGLELRYFIIPNIYAEGGYRFTRRDSDLAAADFDENRVFVRLGAQYAEADLKPLQIDATAGPYVGVQAGHLNLTSEFDGIRGGGGAGRGPLEFDGAGDGGTAGVFVGFEDGVGRWRAALELEADKSEAEWDHFNAPDGRLFDAQREYSYGASALVGYLMNERALLYGRVGVVRTRFDTDYRIGSGNDFSEEHTQTGLRVGVGTEVTLTDRMFWRADYTFTDYNDYVINAPSGNDVFDNRESIFRIGVGYRFYDMPGQGDDEGDSEWMHDFEGPYAGVQAGYGSLQSVNTGPRSSGRSIDVNRGGRGFTGGGFAGYGFVIGGVFLGGELELEGGNAGWEQTRQGGSNRLIKVDKDYTYGASARLGYLVADAAMLYGRAGVVRTRFDTDYSVGGNSVSPEDAQTGLRFGGGVELPADENVFVRLDYTFTTYERYDVNYVSGVDGFDNSESLFRIGIGYRF